MKIALVTETFIPATDGIVTRLKYAIKYMKDQGHSVIVYAPEVSGTPSSYYGAPVKTFPAFTFPFYKERPWAVPSLSLGLHLKQDQPDVVHAFNPFSLAASGAFFADKFEIPLVSSFHTNIPHYLKHYGFDWAVDMCWSYIRHWHNLSDMNMVPSVAMRDLLTEQGIDNPIVLPKGVDLEQRNPKFKDEAMRARLLNDSNKEKLLLFVGRLAPEKDIDQLKELLLMRDDVHLAIVGDGPDRERLEEHFQGFPVTFTGFLHGEEIAKAFASADAFIFPSVSETLGQVLLEAMASGLPVIAAESGPTNEQVKDGQNGLLYTQGHTQQLSKQIDKLEDAEFTAHLIQQGLSYASKFSWNNTTQTMLDAYDEAIERHVFGQKQNEIA